MKTINSDIKVYLQELEQDSASDLSKMDNHWDDFRNTICISSPTTGFNWILKYRKIIVGACSFLLVFILWILFMGKSNKNDIKSSLPTEEMHQNSKVKLVATDTLPVGVEADTIIPAKTPVKKPTNLSERIGSSTAADTISRPKAMMRFARPQRIVSSIPTDTISRTKAKMRFARPKQIQLEREKATLIIDSLN